MLIFSLFRICFSLLRQDSMQLLLLLLLGVFVLSYLLKAWGRLGKHG